ncbi:MAG: hypothetical protein KC441_20015 [Anaerolineales bacterium]|nr:hypothetical protein [Anaerolineales bacterium]
MRRQRRAIALLAVVTLFSLVVFSLQAAQAAPAETEAIQQDNPAEATANITIDASAAGTAVNPYLLGTNVPSWLGTWRTENSTFINRTVAAGVTMVRVPGGSWSNYYDWSNCEQNGVCPWDWGVLTPTDFINFSQATGTELMYTVNQNGTAKEAAALVAFFNGSVNDNTVIGVDVQGHDWGTVAQWAQLRSNHGNSDPHPITYWEIGNEIYGGISGTDCSDYGWEEVWTCDGREYVNGIGSGGNRHEGYLEFRDEMKRIDPSIQVGAVGVAPQDSWNNWGNEVIEEAGDEMDFYVIHQYAYFTPPASYQEALAQPESSWSWIRDDYDDALEQYANGRNIPVAFTEHNLFSVQDQDNGQWMTRAVNMLFMADSIGQMAAHHFDIANQWDLANGQAGNGTDYGLLNADSYARSPQYYVFPLWSRFGSTMLPVTSSYNASNTLSVYAGRVDGSTVSLLAINKTGNAINATVQVNGVSGISGGLVDVVKANSLDSQSVTFNGVSNPNDSLSNAPSTSLNNPGNPLSYSFAPYSVTLLRLDTDGQAPTQSALSVGDTSVTEGNSGNSSATFTVSLSAASADPVTVDYATGDDSAKSGSDFTAVNGTLTFNPGQTSKTVDVSITGDEIDEGSSEKFNFTLSNGSVEVTDGQAVGTIQDDDTAALSIAPGPAVMEGDAGPIPAIFNVSLSTLAAFAVTVDYASGPSAGNAATAGSDYTAVNGTLTFDPGQTAKDITVMVMGDTQFEGVETFNVMLSNANPVAITTAVSVGRILNDDAASDFLFLPAIGRN